LRQKKPQKKTTITKNSGQNKLTKMGTLEVEKLNEGSINNKMKYYIRMLNIINQLSHNGELYQIVFFFFVFFGRKSKNPRRKKIYIY
jgi:hypothetical protein